MQNGKHEALVARVLAGWGNGNRESLPGSHTQSLQVRPEALSIERGHAPIRDVEETLCHAPIPKFRFGACLESLMPLRQQILGPSFPEAALPQEVNESEIITTHRT